MQTKYRKEPINPVHRGVWHMQKADLNYTQTWTAWVVRATRPLVQRSTAVKDITKTISFYSFQENTYKKCTSNLRNLEVLIFLTFGLDSFWFNQPHRWPEKQSYILRIRMPPSVHASVPSGKEPNEMVWDWFSHASMQNIIYQSTFLLT